MSGTKIKIIMVAPEEAKQAAARLADIACAAYDGDVDIVYKRPSDERAEIRETEVVDLLDIDNEVEVYFQKKYDWDVERSERAAIDVYFLRAVTEYIDLCDALPEGFNWDDILDQLEVQRSEFGHSLPNTRRKLKRLLHRHNRMGNDAVAFAHTSFQPA